MGLHGFFLNHCLSFYIFNLDCGQNVAVPNGLVDFTNKLTTYGQSVPVTCDRGYNITEETHIECLANGTWSRTSGCEIIGNFFRLLWTLETFIKRMLCFAYSS